MIHGSSRHSRVVAVVVPTSWPGTSEQHIVASLTDTAARLKGTLRHFEVPVMVHIADEPFTMENGGLTKTSKLCRHEIRARYKDAIEDMLDRTLELDARAADERTAFITALLNKCVKAGVAPSVEELEQWGALDWSSVHIMHNQEIIRTAFNMDLPLPQLYKVKHDLPRLVDMIQLVMSGGELAQDHIDWEAECALPQGLALAADSEGATGCALLTGGTGFLGAALLRELLERYPELRVVCIARAKPGQTADSRLRAALEERDQWSEAVEAAAEEGRFWAVEGELGEERFGLSLEKFKELAREVDTVWHCASWVDHVAGYDTLKAVNVGGTTEMVRLSCVRGTPLTVHYISTMSVLEQGAPEASPGSEEHLTHRGGYPQSKWVAECRLREAHARGLCQLRSIIPVSYTHLRAHETPEHLVCRLLLEKKKQQ
eukprot:TRINITY_DN49132_c0_g1_i1.p1 TRINITY_DN49132_c0_g1~~TRINITY_DN49132_c0_g1_i1.p1  ORF type:complete len:431 (-),score=107.60 TRINITY_DN49132_c0_g1_i1:11-1303(-)